MSLLSLKKKLRRLNRYERVLTASETLGFDDLMAWPNLVCNSASAITLTLPAASVYLAGVQKRISNKGAGVVTLSVAAGWGGSSITTDTIDQGELIDVYCDGSYWYTPRAAIGSTTFNGAVTVGSAGVGHEVIFHGDGAGSYMQYDDDANTGTGRLNLLLSTLRTTENRTLNEAAAAIRMYNNESGANKSARAIIGETYLNAAVVATGTSHHEMNAVNGQVILQATSQINGTGLCISGVKGEIRGSGTQSACNFLTCVLAKYNNATELTTGDSCLFLGWSHAGVVDFGLLIEVTDSGSIGTAGLQIGKDTAPAGDVFFYGTASGTYVKWDDDSNEQGRFNVTEASSRFSCSHHDGQNTGLGNECCFAARQNHNCTTTTGQTQGGRAVYAEYTLATANTNASELSWAGMFAVEGTVILNGTLNGSMVNAFGVAGELRGAGAITECRDIAPLAAINNASVNPSTGRKSMIYSDNSSGTVDAVLTHRGSCTSLLDMNDASGFVLEDNQEWGTKAGSLKVIMPSGGAAYVNLYDGTQS